MSQTHEIRVLTFNVKMLPPFADTKRAERIVAAVVDRGYDVVCLQEVFDEDAREAFIKGFKDKLPYMVEIAGSSGPRQDSGLFFATRFTKLHHSFRKFRFPLPVGLDFIAKKGVLGVQLAVGGEFRLFVFNTHLDSKRASERKHQLGRIARLMAGMTGLARKPLKAAVLLCGDMNVKADSTQKEYRRMLQWLGEPRDIHAEANPEKPGYTHPADEPEKRIDYWFAFDTVLTGLEPQSFLRVVVNSTTVDPFNDPALSDHLPVETQLTLRS